MADKKEDTNAKPAGEPPKTSKPARNKRPEIFYKNSKGEKGKSRR